MYYALHKASRDFNDSVASHSVKLSDESSNLIANIDFVNMKLMFDIYRLPRATTYLQKMLEYDVKLFELVMTL